MMQLSLTVGFMVPFALGPYVSVTWLAIASGLVPVLFAASFFSMPESPCVLLARGDTVDASDALQWLRGQDRNGILPELRKLEVRGSPLVLVTKCSFPLSRFSLLLCPQG